MPAENAITLARLRERPHQIEWFLALAPCGDPIWGGYLGTGSFRSMMELLCEECWGDWDGIQPGMTLWVGTTSGTYDKGTIRIRWATGSYIGVAENDNIEWTPGDCLTVPGEAGFRELWGVFPRLVEGVPVTFYKDYDILFTNQGDHLPPKANAGPPALLPIYSTTGTAVGYFIGEDSYPTQEGEIITGTYWTFPDGLPPTSILEGTRTSPIGVSWNTTGFRYVRLDVVDTLGTTGTTHVPVWVYDPTGPSALYSKVEVQKQSGANRSGWDLRIKVFEADEKDFPDQSLVVLGTKTHFGPTREDLGGYPFRENVGFVGWLDRETLTFDSTKGTVEFEAVSSDQIMRYLPGFSFSLDHVDPPTDWPEISHLNVDSAFHFALEFHSTVNQVCHVERVGEGESRRISSPQVFSETSIYQQVTENLLDDAQCGLTADRQGILRATRDPQMMDLIDRNLVDVMCGLVERDLQDDVSEPKSHRPSIGMVEAGGWFLNTPLLGDAPGPAPLQQTRETRLGELIVTSQAELNLWAGLKLAALNNPYGEVLVNLVGYWSILDPAYQEWVRLTVEDPLERNPLDNQRFVVREVTFNFAPQQKTVTTSLSLEMESWGPTGQSVGVPPPPDPEPNPPPPPPVYPVPEPVIVVIHSRGRIFRTNDWQNLNPTWTEVTGALNGVIYAVEMDQGSRGCWAVTGTDNNIGDYPNGDQGAGVGVWHTGDITVAIPLWVLVFSQAAAFALVGLGGGSCGAYTWGASWGQLRSVCPLGPQMAYVGEAKAFGLAYGPGAGHEQCSHIFEVTPLGGTVAATPFRSACYICPPYTECHANAPHMRLNAHLAQMLAGWYFSCHQISLGRSGAPLYAGMAYDGTGWCKEGLPCPGTSYSSIPIPPPQGDWDQHQHFQGSRHGIDVGGMQYGVTVDGHLPAGGVGMLYGSMTLPSIDQDIWADNSFVNITSGFTHLYYCRPADDPLRPGENQVMQLAFGAFPSSPLNIFSGDLFGARGVGYNEGLIGHIRCLWTDPNQLIIVRKDEPDAGQPNRTVIWLYDTCEGTLTDKTGNLPNNWYGTGRRLPAFPWSFRLDNVGCTAPGMPLR